MATIDLGRIKMVWKGTYAGGTAYVPDDVVEYTDTGITSTYICTTASTGNAPSSGGTAHGSWAYMAKGTAVTPTTTRGDTIYRGASADQRLPKGTSGHYLRQGTNDPYWDAVYATPTTTRGDIVYRGASADQRLAKGSSGQVLTMGANDPEWAAGFAGTHYLAYSNKHSHTTEVHVNGNSLSNGNADGQRDCIVINNGNYHTVTPAHADDIIVMYVQTLIYSNWNNNGSYWGLGMMHSTSTNFANNRNTFYQVGQHAWGNGASSNGDHYEVCSISQQWDVSEIGMSAGTTYYFRGIGQIHSPNKQVEFNNYSGTSNNSGYYSWLRHYKRNA